MSEKSTRYVFLKMRAVNFDLLFPLSHSITQTLSTYVIFFILNHSMQQAGNFALDFTEKQDFWTCEIKHARQATAFYTSLL